MDQAKLQALRSRYQDAGVFEADDPVLKEALRGLSTAGGKRTLPYAGVPTFLALPYAESLAGLDIAAIGIPMDLGVSNRSGARFGPRAVRTIERIGPYHPTFRGVPKSKARAADVGDVPFRSRYSLEQSIEDIESYYLDVVAQGVRPLSVGGDHSVTYPILKALGRDRPVGLVHIDAHCDTMGPYDGAKFHHGGPFRHAVLAGVLDPERTIQIGIRGASNVFWEFSHTSGMTVVYMEEFMETGVAAVAATARCTSRSTSMASMRHTLPGPEPRKSVELLHARASPCCVHSAGWTLSGRTSLKWRRNMTRPRIPLN
jgi:guanidinopropionase